jgi:iron-sulfur cluster assembly protein
MLTITDKAVSVLSGLCIEEALALRISVNAGSCAGIRYDMNLQDKASDEDEILYFGPLQVLIAPSSAMWLTGVTIDYVEGSDGPGFQFDAPVLAAGCSCANRRE